MKFVKLHALLIEGSAFKSLRDAANYCRLLRKTGTKCRPKRLPGACGYYQIEYLNVDNKEVKSHGKI